MRFEILSFNDIDSNSNEVNIVCSLFKEDVSTNQMTCFWTCTYNTIVMYRRIVKPFGTSFLTV